VQRHQTPLLLLLQLVIKYLVQQQVQLVTLQQSSGHVWKQLLLLCSMLCLLLLQLNPPLPKPKVAWRQQQQH
jgi:hypothetical protein